MLYFVSQKLRRMSSQFFWSPNCFVFSPTNNPKPKDSQKKSSKSSQLRGYRTMWCFLFSVGKWLKWEINNQWLMIHFLLSSNHFSSACFDSQFNSRSKEQCVPLFLSLLTLGGQSVTLSFLLNLLWQVTLQNGFCQHLCIVMHAKRRSHDCASAASFKLVI